MVGRLKRNSRREARTIGNRPAEQARATLGRRLRDCLGEATQPDSAAQPPEVKREARADTE